MPGLPVIDTHLHIWNHSRLVYAGLRWPSLFGRDYHSEDHAAARDGVDLEAVVFLECHADFAPAGGQCLEEIAVLQEEVLRDPRLKAIVPLAPLDRRTQVERCRS